MASDDWDHGSGDYESGYRRYREQLEHEYMTTVTFPNGMRFSVEAVSFMFHALNQAVRSFSIEDSLKGVTPDLDAVLELPGGRVLRFPSAWAARYPDIAQRLGEMK